ncbi:MAG: hypothetical protein E7342_03480 [Clostridiales bacterium]|nr:hypothetical protein [Clostridiales bacterium]
MITTKQENGRQILNQGGVALLEREDVKQNYSEEISFDKQRMSENLERLLNYDKYLEEAVEETVVVDKVEEYSPNDVDITPTDTTMQFGEMDSEIIRSELRIEAEEQAESVKAKGKVYLIVYSVLVTVVLALIVLNTSILASISATNQAKQAEVDALQAQFLQLQEEYNTISSDDYVINIAQNEYNMVK